MNRQATKSFMLSDLIDIKHGFAFQSEYFGSTGKYLLLTPGNFYEAGGFRDLGTVQKRYSGPVPTDFILQKGDILVAMTEQSPGLLGAAIRVPVGNTYLHNQRLGLVQIKKPDSIDRGFLYHLFNASHVRKDISTASSGTKVKHTSPSKICSLKVQLPALREQEASASVLDTWDALIEKMEGLIAAKEKSFAWLNNSFIADRCRSWKHLHADNIFESISEKKNDNEELLSVTQDRGVIPRTMLEGRVMSPEGSTDGYKLVKVGDFVISLRSFQGGIEYSRYQGLISPAYTVLRPRIEIHDEFYRHFLKSYIFIEKYLSIAVIGIRDGKQISAPDFMTVKIPCPPIEQQKEIANVLNAARQEIDLLKRQCETYRKQKRGLMQKLLTGEWRVKIAGEVS